MRQGPFVRPTGEEERRGGGGMDCGRAAGGPSSNQLMPLPGEGVPAVQPEAAEPVAAPAEAEPDGAGERAPVNARARPTLPTTQEVEDHNVTHYPYRACCRYCVASAGRRDRHERDPAGGQDDAVPVVAADYGFLSTGPEEGPKEGMSPILVVRDTAGRSVFADMVSQKGPDEWAVLQMTNHVLSQGYPSVRLRSDGEPAIKALLLQVGSHLGTQGMRVVPETLPVADSQAAGLIESTVKLVKEKARCLWHSACELHGVQDMRQDHPLAPWVVQYAGQLITRSVVGDDGLTA